jgi:hypothetical protein
MRPLVKRVILGRLAVGRPDFFVRRGLSQTDRNDYRPNCTPVALVINELDMSDRYWIVAIIIFTAAFEAALILGSALILFW